MKKSLFVIRSLYLVKKIQKSRIIATLFVSFICLNKNIRFREFLNI